LELDSKLRQPNQPTNPSYNKFLLKWVWSKIEAGKHTKNKFWNLSRQYKQIFIFAGLMILGTNLHTPGLNVCR